MKFFRSLQIYHLQLAAVVIGIVGTHADAVTQFRKTKIPFLFDIDHVQYSLNLAVSDHKAIVKMDEAYLETRLKKSSTDETVEPLTLSISNPETAVAKLSEQLALQDYEDEFSDFLRKSLKKAKSNQESTASTTIKITPKAFSLLDKESFSDLYAKSHHDLTILADALKKDRYQRTELLHQLRPFLSASELRLLGKKINRGESLKVDRDLLPEFPRKMVRRYVVYRGPNCFHAALAFHSPVLTASSLINVKTEAGYHRAMINYDELWRAINRNFYEIDPEKVALKYGDMLVFFDVPKDELNRQENSINFRWIRHTATYLFSGYTFSKGSKSSNTPYTVRTLSEEWQTWKHFTKNLGVKVFRRAMKTVNYAPPVDLTDWIY